MAVEHSALHAVNPNPKKRKEESIYFKPGGLYWNHKDMLPKSIGWQFNFFYILWKIHIPFGDFQSFIFQTIPSTAEVVTSW